MCFLCGSNEKEFEDKINSITTKNVLLKAQLEKLGEHYSDQIKLLEEIVEDKEADLGKFHEVNKCFHEENKCLIEKIKRKADIIDSLRRENMHLKKENQRIINYHLSTKEFTTWKRKYNALKNDMEKVLKED